MFAQIVLVRLFHNLLLIETGIDSRDRPDSHGEQAVHHHRGLYPAAVSGMEWPGAINGIYRVRPGIPASTALGWRQVVVEEAKSGARGRCCRTPSRQHTKKLRTGGIVNKSMPVLDTQSVDTRHEASCLVSVALDASNRGHQV